jgi:hypothetical protein
MAYGWDSAKTWRSGSIRALAMADEHQSEVRGVMQNANVRHSKNKFLTYAALHYIESVPAILF